MATWEYEQITGFVRQAPALNYIPIFRAYDGTDHFYTADENEYNSLPAGYQREGERFYLADHELPGHVPLYTLYHPGEVDHYLTTDSADRDRKISQGWEDKGILGYVASTQAPGLTLLYQAFHPDFTDHLYTTDQAELAGLGSPTPDSPAALTVQSGFDPEKHGFLFPNRFRLEPAIFGLTLGSWELGFCGGMSLVAIRAYNAGQPLSRRLTIPRQKEGLYRQLLDSQLETIPLPIITKLQLWQSSQDFNVTGFSRSIGKRTKQDWPKIRAELDHRRPVVLVLVRVRGFFGNLTLNHQIVATGYKAYQNDQVFAIQIYDPNHPRENGEIVFSTLGSQDRINAHQRPRRDNQPLRGFFLNHKG